MMRPYFYGFHCSSSNALRYLKFLAFLVATSILIPPAHGYDATSFTPSLIPSFPVFPSAPLVSGYTNSTPSDQDSAPPPKEAGPNVIGNSKTGFYGDPGYEVREGPSSYFGKWIPRFPYRERGKITILYVIASHDEGYWRPAPGYVWVDGVSNDNHAQIKNPTGYSVKWVKGEKFLIDGQQALPNIISCSREGEWFPEVGWNWSDIDENGRPEDFNVSNLSVGKPGYFGIFQDQYWSFSPEDTEKFLARKQGEALERRWAIYLKNIQEQGDSENWKDPPFDLFLISHPTTTWCHAGIEHF